MQFKPPPDRFDRLPGSARHILIVSNPKAGSRSRLEHLESLCAQLRKHAMQPCQISSLKDLTAAATDLLARNELRAIVAAGGDGTISEVANRTPPGTPMTVLPLGTENLLAKYLKITADPAALADLIAAGHTAWLDAGQANGRIFLLMASAGFDAEVVHRLHELREGNITHWSYAKPILKTIWNYRYPELRVSFSPPDGSPTQTVSCRWTFIFNLPCYAFGLKFARDANALDGELDLRTFRRRGFFRGLQYLAAVIRGRHQNLADVTVERAASFRIESDEPVLYELDGDPCGQLPLEITCLPRRLRLIVDPAIVNLASYE